MSRTMFDEIIIKEMSPIDAYNYGRQMMEKELNKLGECEYNKGRADAIKDTELFREIYLEELVNQSVNREEAIMYTNICTMSWNKYLKLLKVKNNEQSI